MSRCGLLGILLATSLLLAGVGLVPVGSGPYTVVYGPATALRAQRAFLLLVLVCVVLSAMALAVLSFREWAAILPAAFPEGGGEHPGLLSPVFGLRC